MVMRRRSRLRALAAASCRAFVGNALIGEVNAEAEGGFAGLGGVGGDGAGVDASAEEGADGNVGHQLAGRYDAGVSSWL